MTEVQAARMPASQSYTMVPAASAAAAASALSASVAAPAAVITLSPEARQHYLDGQQVVAKLTDGAKQVKAADQAFRLAAAKEKLKELKMLAELAAATGDAKLAKSVAKDLATVSRQLGVLAQDVTQGGAAPASSDSASSSTASADGSAAAPATTASGATATGTPGATVPAATDAQSVMAEIHSLALEAKKILDTLRAAPHLRSKADKELAAAAKDVTQAVTDTTDGLDGSAGVTATAASTGTSVNLAV